MPHTRNQEAFAPILPIFEWVQLARKQKIHLFVNPVVNPGELRVLPGAPPGNEPEQLPGSPTQLGATAALLGSVGYCGCL